MTEKINKRKRSRENAFLAQFELGFCQTNLQELQENLLDSEAYRLDGFANQLLTMYQEHADQVEPVIESHLRGWSADRLTRTSQSLLRLSVAEMLFGEDNMDSVIINEAVELAKKYAGDKDYRFVNGVLGTISREIHPEQNVTSVLETEESEEPEQAEKTEATC